MLGKPSTQHSLGTSCKDITADEKMLFFGIHLAMGVHKLPSVEDFIGLFTLFLELRKSFRACQYIN